MFEAIALKKKNKKHENMFFVCLCWQSVIVAK